VTSEQITHAVNAFTLKLDRAISVGLADEFTTDEDRELKALWETDEPEILAGITESTAAWRAACERQDPTRYIQPQFPLRSAVALGVRLGLILARYRVLDQISDVHSDKGVPV